MTLVVCYVGCDEEYKKTIEIGQNRQVTFENLIQKFCGHFAVG